MCYLMVLHVNFQVQVISNVAYIILEESDLGEIGHNFWKEVKTILYIKLRDSDGK